MNRDEPDFKFLKEKFSSLSAKIKEGVFVGPDVTKLIKDLTFISSLNEVEKEAK